MDLGIEGRSRISSDLYGKAREVDMRIKMRLERGRIGIVELTRGRCCEQTHEGFTLLDVLLAEEELAIEVGEVDGVKV